MAGRGPAPKAPEARRNFSKPQRGEWVDLPPLEDPVLPELPDDHEWAKRTTAAWERWRQDPVTSQYGPSEIQNAIDLAYLYDSWVRGKGDAPEVRQWLDRLGLNAKGKRDLRWRLVEDPGEEKPAKREGSRSPRRRSHLTAVK